MVILDIGEAHRSDGIALYKFVEAGIVLNSTKNGLKVLKRNEGYVVYPLRTMELVQGLPLFLLHPFVYQLHCGLNWNRDMSRYHTASQLETNFSTLNAFWSISKKCIYLHWSATVDLYIQHLNWQNLSEEIAFHLKKFNGFLQWNTLYHKYNPQIFTHCKRRGPLH